MLTVTAYRQRLVDAVAPPAPQRVGIDDPTALLGLVTSEPVHSQVSLPPFTNSAMDGYAVRAADTAGAPVTLPVSGDIPAGDTRELTLEPGTALRIMTGAPVPGGADAVVQVEHTDGGTAQVRIDRETASGAAIRRAGDDITSGQLVLPAGVRIAARHLPVLVSTGVREVAVHPRPRVAVISTGDELRPPGTELEHGQIVDSNGPMLAALALESGFDVVSVGQIGDTGDAARAAVRELAGRTDAIITSGGVSAGAFEPMRLAFEGDGALEFVKVAVQPGKPQAFGHLGGIPVFGLPGNPASALVSYVMFVAPALRAMAGRPVEIPTQRREVAAGWKPAAPDRTQVARVRVRPDGRIEQSGGPGSHLLGGLAGSDALAIVPQDVTEVATGDTLDVVSFASDEIRHGPARSDTSQEPR